VGAVASNRNQEEMTGVILNSLILRFSPDYREFGHSRNAGKAGRASSHSGSFPEEISETLTIGDIRVFFYPGPVGKIHLYMSRKSIEECEQP
jgi:hypothetical protein